MEGSEWNENWIEGLSDLLISERAEIITLIDGSIAVRGSKVPFEFLSRVFRAAYTTKFFPTEAERRSKYEFWIGKDKFSYVEWDDGTEEFLKNGAFNCSVGPARFSQSNEWEEFWRDGILRLDDGEQMEKHGYVDGAFYNRGKSCDAMEFVRFNAQKTIFGGQNENWWAVWYYENWVVVRCKDGSEFVLSKGEPFGGFHHTSMNNAMLKIAAAMSNEEILNYTASFKQVKLGSVIKPFYEVWGSYGDPAHLKFQDDGSVLLQKIRLEDGKIIPIYLFDATKNQLQTFTDDAVIIQDLTFSEAMKRINLMADRSVDGTQKRGVKMSNENDGRLSTIGGGVATGIKKGAVKVVSSKAAKYVSDHLPMNDKLPMESIAQLALLNLTAEVIERAPEGAAAKVGLTKERRQAAGEMIRTTSGEILGKNLMGLFGKLAPMLLDGLSMLSDTDITDTIGESEEVEEKVAAEKIG